MKTLRVLDENNNIVRGWYFGTFKNVLNCGGNIEKPRRISGWSIVSPDGVERLNEGNWEQFVPFAKRIVNNYGFKTLLS